MKDETKSEVKGYERILLVFQNYRMFNFLCALVILLVLTAVLEGYHYAHSLLSTLGVFVFVAGGYAACTNKRSLAILLALAIPWILAEWFFPASKIVYLSFFFFLYLIVLLLRMVIASYEITSNTLYGAACVYLLLGMLWATLYGFINEIFPGSIFSGMTSTDISGTATASRRAARLTASPPSFSLPIPRSRNCFGESLIR